MSASSEDLKPAAQRLAQLLSSDEGARIVSLMRHLGLVQAAPAAAAAPPPGIREERVVGIWRADLADGTFVRDGAAERMSLWADVETIGPKRNGQRVAWVGESVARGYFHDPEYTPASALQTMLRSAPGLSELEVVDLARSDLQYRPLLQLAESALLLEPDALVVLAGNNWRPVINTTRDRVELSLLLRSGSLLDVRAYLEDRLAALAGLFVRTLADISTRTKVPVVVVIPEFNLVDWRCDLDRAPPWLADDDRRRWVSLHEQATRAESAREDDQVQSLGQQLLDLDGGMSAVGPSLVARALLRAGRRDEARAFFERARDARLWFTDYETPRCHAEIQRVLREEAPALGLTVVDLPATFAASSGGDLPDRRLFLDYCHLTSDGIRTAMAGVAERLAPLLGSPAASASTFARADVPPGAWVRAQASLLAAAHCTRWGQRRDILEHHCAEALRADPAILEVMSRMIDFGTHRNWRGLSRAFNGMRDLSARAVERYFAAAERASGQASFEFVDVLAAASMGAKPQGGAFAHLEELRRKEHAVDTRDVDLLRSAYIHRRGFRDLIGWGEFAGFCQMTEREATFLFVSGGRKTVRLAFTYRVPGTDGGELVSMTINGSHLASLPASSQWRATTLSIAPEALVEGVNELGISWPDARGSSLDALASLADDLELGETGDPYPVLGEVHVLRASAIET